MLILVRSRKDVASAWRSGHDHELGFWEKRIDSGFEGPERRLDPERELVASIARFLPETDPVKILDVGAGPATSLGFKAPGHVLEIAATDALADQYNERLRSRGMTPPVWTQQCETEHLDALFPADCFDIVHAGNTLDHHYDLVAAIEQMLRVTKPGGVLVFRHAENEGEFAAYEGLHQFNFTLREGKPTAWNRDATIDIDELLAGRATRLEAERMQLPGGKAHAPWIWFVYRKSAVSA